MVTVFGITLSILIIDQLSKLLILKNFYPGQTHPVIKNIFHLTLVCNQGVAFGMFSDQGFIFLWISIACVIIIGLILTFSKKLFQQNRPTQISLSLILAGALGNLIDRIRFGFVIDFLDLRIWPVFNIADSAITIGTILLIYSLLKKPVTR